MSTTSPTGSVEDQIKQLKDFEPSYSCRFHPTDGWHEVGCPHQEWTAEQLQDALNSAKQSNAYLIYRTASEVRKAPLDELKTLSKTDWAYDEAFGSYLKERIAELEGEERHDI